MKDFPKIKLPAASTAAERPTPVQFLPSAMLSWRAPIMTRRQPVELRPEPLLDACAPAR